MACITRWWPTIRSSNKTNLKRLRGLRLSKRCMTLTGTSRHGRANQRAMPATITSSLPVSPALSFLTQQSTTTLSTILTNHLTLPRCRSSFHLDTQSLMYYSRCVRCTPTTAPQGTTSSKWTRTIADLCHSSKTKAILNTDYLLFFDSIHFHRYLNLFSKSFTISFHGVLGFWGFYYF